MRIPKKLLCAALLLLALFLVSSRVLHSHTLGVIGGADGPTAIIIGQITP